MVAAPSTSPLIGDESEEARDKSLFLDCLRLVERLHRRQLDVVRACLEKIGKSDINSVQALLIYNIGSSEMTAGELRTRGYYLGSNVSYNLKKLVEQGYLSHEKAEHDRRAVKIALTEKGVAVRDAVDALFTEHLSELLDDELLKPDDLAALRRHLRNMERYWSDQLRFI